MKGRARAVLSSCLLVLALSGRARAGDEQAAADFFRAGKAAYARGDYRAAATSFEAAYREAPRAATRYNAAIAWGLAREGARAADDFEATLARPDGLSEEQLRDARERLARLGGTLGRFEISGPPGSKVSVAHVESEPLPARVHVAPGEHRVSVVLAGGQRQLRVARVAAGATRALAFAEPARSDALEPPRVAQAPPRAPVAGEEQDATSPLVVGGWIAVGGGAVLGVATGVLGASAVAANDDFDADRTDAEARDEAVRLRTWTNVALAGALVCAGAGVTLLILAPSKPDAPAVSIRVGPGAASAFASF